MWQVRFCKGPAENIADIVNPDNEMERPMFRGIMSFTFNTIIEFIYHNTPPVNRSGSDFSYKGPSGCKAAVLRNETDVALGQFNYPNDDYHDLENGVLPYEIFDEERV